MNDNALRWIQFAQYDLQAAEILMREQVYHLVCFHAQQTVEKALKAVLAQQQKLPPRTHSITDLLNFFPPTFFGEFSETLELLDAYYLPTRYPDALPGTLPDGLPNAEQASEALAAANFCLNKIRDNLQTC